MPLNFLDFNSSYFFKKSLGVELVSAIFFLAAWADTWLYNEKTVSYLSLILQLKHSSYTLILVFTFFILFPLHFL